jgi:hypothetical protein
MKLAPELAPDYQPQSNPNHWGHIHRHGRLHDHCGSKFNAMNHPWKTPIERYLTELDRAHRQHKVAGRPVSAAKVGGLTRGVQALKQQLQSSVGSADASDP